MTELITTIIILAPPLLLALTLHEYAHGYVAYRLGDPTAKSQGRLSLNPIKHLDPLGTIAFFLIHFGWAKPVPVNPVFFQNPKKGMLWVALAGPATNLAVAVCCASLAKIIAIAAAVLPDIYILDTLIVLLSAMLVAAVWINLVLCIFNFLPIPPLDGSRILTGLLPRNLAILFIKSERYSAIFFLILILFFREEFANLILPLISFANDLLLS